MSDQIQSAPPKTGCPSCGCHEFKVIGQTKDKFNKAIKEVRNCVKCQTRYSVKV